MLDWVVGENKNIHFARPKVMAMHKSAVAQPMPDRFLQRNQAIVACHRDTGPLQRELIFHMQMLIEERG